MSSELIYILSVFKKYDLEYDKFNKILIINEPIHPRDFYFIRNNVLKLKDGVKDVIVGRHFYKKRGMR